MADKKGKKKGILGKAVDAVSSRDERAEAEAAEAQAAKAKREAARADAQRQLAEARAEQSKREAEKSEAAAKDAAERVQELEAKLAKMEAEAEAAAQAAATQAKQEEMRDKLEAYQAKKAEEEKPPVYVVQSGDSLSKIAKEQLGDARRWPEIQELNKDQIPNPNLIRVGQELTLPKA